MLNRVPDSRADRLAAAAGEAGLDAVVVGDLVRPGDSERSAMADVSWLTGFKGTSGIAVVGPSVRSFLTDFRYVERARGVVPESFEVVDSTAEMIGSLAAALAGRVGLDERTVSVHYKAKLDEKLAAGGGEVELVGAADLLAALRRSKDADEIAAIRAASELTDQVFAELVAGGIAGRSEREVAVWVETRMRQLGAEGPSFPPIVAAGENGASPHAEPGERVIAAGEYVVVDMGAIVDGYCSDGTRTICEGEPDGGQREIYEVVLRAQAAALDALAERGVGASGRDIDRVAREVIEEAGYGERFGHGLGHGVGIEIHEAPRLSSRSDDVLVVGDVVTVEPGIYVPGSFGVRIEDLVVIVEGGIENLSSHPK